VLDIIENVVLRWVEGVEASRADVSDVGVDEIARQIQRRLASALTIAL
jgi:hypothetical protein